MNRMAYETEVILKQILLNILSAESLEEIQTKAKLLVTKEQLAEIEKVVTELKKN